MTANSPEEVADVLDTVGDPGACDVHEFLGPLLLEVRPDGRRVGCLAFSETGSEFQEDCSAAIAKAAFPKIRPVLRSERLTKRSWHGAIRRERERKLSGSPGWALAVKRWWEAFSGGQADRTAALRQLANVSIPGEPKPETREQAALFEAEQRRIIEQIGVALDPSASRTPPTEPTKKSDGRKRKRPETDS